MLKTFYSSPYYKCYTQLFDTSPELIFCTWLVTTNFRIYRKFCSQTPDLYNVSLFIVHCSVIRIIAIIMTPLEVLRAAFTPSIYYWEEIKWTFLSKVLTCFALLTLYSLSGLLCIVVSQCYSYGIAIHMQDVKG